MKANTLLKFAAFLTIVISLSTCFDITLWDTESDDEPCQGYTEFIGVSFEPNPVIAGESVVFTYKINFDKNAWNITYFWQPDTSSFIQINYIYENYYKTVAPINPGNYVGSVFVNYFVGECGVRYIKHEYFSYEVISKK